MVYRWGEWYLKAKRGAETLTLLASLPSDINRALGT
jgi:hypothetical protein